MDDGNDDALAHPERVRVPVTDDDALALADADEEPVILSEEVDVSVVVGVNIVL